jgi:hypothetical protein
MKPIARYNNLDKFEILDLIALFEFKSSSSISFLLTTEAKFLKPAGSDPIPMPAGVCFNKVGSVDIHYPCDGHIKAQFRFLLPKRYHELTTMKDLVRLLLAKIQIPNDETYEAHFVSEEQHSSIEQAVDRDGMTDRM